MDIKNYLSFWMKLPKIRGKISTAHCKTIYDVDYSQLEKKGIRLLIFDVDDTIAAYEDHIPSRTFDLLQRLKKTFHLALLTNRNVSGRNELAIAFQGLDIYIAPFSNKPSSKGFNNIFSHFRVSAEHCAVVGDKVSTDLWGAMKSNVPVRILVEPYSGTFSGKKMNPFLSFIRSLEIKLS